LLNEWEADGAPGERVCGLGDNYPATIVNNSMTNSPLTGNLFFRLSNP
jgi:hypothetical protein